MFVFNFNLRRCSTAIDTPTCGRTSAAAASAGRRSRRSSSPHTGRSAGTCKAGRCRLLVSRPELKAPPGVCNQRLKLKNDEPLLSSSAFKSKFVLRHYNKAAASAATWPQTPCVTPACKQPRQRPIPAPSTTTTPVISTPGAEGATSCRPDPASKTSPLPRPFVTAFLHACPSSIKGALRGSISSQRRATTTRWCGGAG